jgi:hypothetical protein
VTLGVILFVLALLADMLGRHRRISEELLYLTRRRVYSNRRTVRASLPQLPEELHLEHAESPESMGPTLHDSWSLPVMRSVPAAPAPSVSPPLRGGSPQTPAGQTANGRD